MNMVSPLQTLRLQFFSSLAERKAIREIQLCAADIDSGILQAASFPWPPGSGAWRLSDLNDREVAYRFKEDTDGRPGMIVKFADND